MSRIEEDISILESPVSGVRWPHGGFRYFGKEVFFFFCAWID
jgi:hypothetical protein